MEDKDLIKLSVKELMELGICPTCLNRRTNGAIYGNNSHTKLYEDDDIEVAFVSNPRARGHITIISVPHYQNMIEAPDELNEKIIRYSKFIMNELIKIYDCETVYLCTMCDGNINHYHVQLIPRYIDEQVGSRNFVKERKPYIFEEDKYNYLKERLKSFANK